jgi:hypothetical protein
MTIFLHLLRKSAKCRRIGEKASFFENAPQDEIHPLAKRPRLTIDCYLFTIITNLGRGDKETMIAKLKVSAPPEDFDDTEDIALAVPVTIPELQEIRHLAFTLHRQRRAFDGEQWGWPVSYEPESPNPPIESRLTFTPATFFIGVWPLWYVSFTWEYGRNVEPNILVGNENIQHTSDARIQIEQGAAVFA